MRVLCLSMIPNGGAVARALEVLGYKPYSFASLLTSYHMTSDLQHWAALLSEQHASSSSAINNYYTHGNYKRIRESNGSSGINSNKSSSVNYNNTHITKNYSNEDEDINKIGNMDDIDIYNYEDSNSVYNDINNYNNNAVYNPDLFAAYDVLAGPPAAMRYDVILPQCPSFTKVILVVEPHKEQWARNVEECLAEVNCTFRKRAKLRKHLRNLQTIITNMFVKGKHMHHVDATQHANSKLNNSTSNVNSNHITHNLKELNELPQEEELSEFKTKIKMSSSSALEAALASSANKAASTPSSSLTEKHEEKKMMSKTRTNVKNKTQSNMFSQVIVNEEEDDNDGKGSTKLSHPLAKALQLYEESVQMAIPPSKLLIFHYKDEWQPLCAFLDKPVPEESFPPYDDGLRVLRRLCDRLNFNHYVRQCCKWGFVLYLLYLLYPQMNVWRQYMVDMYEDYKIAHDWDDHNSIPTATSVNDK